MLRWALASYLSLALLAGPAFCCCAAARCAQRIVAHVVPSTPGDKLPACPHCCHSPRPSKPDNEESKAPTPPDRCPCQKDRADIVQLHGSGQDSIRLLEAQSQTALNLLLIVSHQVSDITDSAGDAGFCISRNVLTLHGAPLARLLSVLQLWLC